MIGFEYNGQVNYISRIEDFRDFMEPSVYEALVKALDGGLWKDNYKEMYENLEEEYAELEEENEQLEDVRDELEDCENQLGDMTQKYELLQKFIKVLINRVYLGYVKQEEIIPQLENIVE